MSAVAQTIPQEDGLLTGRRVHNMTAPVEALQQFELRLDRSEVLRLQGYRRGSVPASPQVMALLDQAVAQALYGARSDPEGW